MWITIYTDASYKPNAKKATGAYWIKSDFTRAIGSFAIRAEDSNIAEMKTIIEAVREAKNRHIAISVEGVFINTDNFNAIRAFQYKAKLSKNKEIQQLQKEMIELLGTIKIRMKHIKAHQGVSCRRSYLNDQVDKLAKKKNL